MAECIYQAGTYIRGVSGREIQVGADTNIKLKDEV
jgi:hypothetical protein